MSDETERLFFDKEAIELEDENLVIAPDQIERYKNAKLDSLNISKDALFARILPLEGKTVLDYGCGHGENSILFAACGAQVTAFDLSPESIAKARRRAELHGLSDRITFEVQTAGRLPYADESFDFIVGIAILHHLHTILPKVFAETARLIKRDGTVCFIEPFANSRALRVLRRLVPLPTYATPDERQLTYDDLKPLELHFARPDLYHFYFLERLHRVLGARGAVGLRKLDSLLSQFPTLHFMYGELLIMAKLRSRENEPIK